MKLFPQLRNASLSTRLCVVAVSLCVFSVGLAGCAARRPKTRVYPWSIAASMHPLAPEGLAQSVESEATEPSTEEMSSQVLSQIGPPPSPLFAARSVPVPTRPRVAPGSPTPKEPATEADVPQIAPQLSPAETAAAQQQTNDSLNVAGRALDAAQGRKLNVTQLDLASKIRSFIAEAKDAAQIGDWPRARNAAKKAEVLSQELASSM